MKVETEGQTVREAQAEKVVDLIARGVEPKDAAKTIGMPLATLESLKATGGLSKACRLLLERVEQDKLLNKKTREMIARARLLELMMQDTDLKVALQAARTELEATGPKMAVQINNNLISDPGVIESLKSLQIEIEGEKHGLE